MRSRGLSRTEILSALPGKSLSALDYQLFRTGKRFPRPRGGAASSWSEAELSLVQGMLDEGMKVPQIAIVLRNKLPREIHAAVHHGKLHKERTMYKSDVWSAEEDADLERMLNDRVPDENVLAALPDKTENRSSHRRYPSRTKVARPRLWSDEELATVEQMLRDAKTVPEIAAALPGKTISQIRTRITYGREKFRQRYRKIQHFSKEEDLRLRELKESGAPWSEILTAIPSRNYRSLTDRWNYLEDKESQPHFERHKQEWSAPEDNLLLYLWANQQLSRAIIAGVLQRTKNAISQRIEVLQSPDLTLSRWKGFITHRVSRDQAIEISNFIRTELAKPGIIKLDDILAEFDGNIKATVPPRHSQSYTPEEDDLILRMRMEGRAWKDIADEAIPGRTKQGLYQRWMRLKQRESTITAAAESVR
ncbi:hypothetical protein K431DRAFT_299841 [Polychaeton citri CBS 116435]|uniref:Myb-like domain-containing protein n=1 Tax=Polychaeton citri CBS 116435 TaxID=1314669 RepID=A0A9P4QDZ1_9PEZI|nr:hypothetical protein K431DRAFT_299841 [Polychaeton citri CBS 116435]